MATNREKEAIRKVLAEVRSPCIVELGAHTGEDEPWIREACREGEAVHYVLAEPDMRNAQMLLETPTTRTRRVILGAISSRDGMSAFHFSENDREHNHASGSLRQPTGHLKYFPYVTFERTAWVPTYTLDTLFEREWLSKIDLLWVDIQGAEADMIVGGLSALTHTRYLFMEAENEELYSGQALKGDLLRMLPRWKLIEDFGCNILLKNQQFSEREPR